MIYIETILPTEVKERLANGEHLNIIDVREDHEVAVGMIPGAKHIPLNVLPFSHESIERSGEVIIVCRVGQRSERAAEYLQLLGFKGVKNMIGGMLQWDLINA